MYRIKKFKFARKKAKYKNVPQDFKGQQYHSKFEAKVARDLDLRLRTGELKEVRRQVKIELYAWGEHICDYYIDFVVEHADGRIEYLEVKGFETPVWRLKWKIFEAQMRAKHPDALLTVMK